MGMYTPDRVRSESGTGGISLHTRQHRQGESKAVLPGPEAEAGAVTAAEAAEAEAVEKKTETERN